MNEVLGVANEYRANWIARSFGIRVRAKGLLPCYNYEAVLVHDLADDARMTFEMTFIIDNFCHRTEKPFSVESGTVYSGDDPSSATVVIRDAVGDHEIDVVEDDYGQPDKLRTNTADLSSLSEQYVVYAKLPKHPDYHNGCITVPASSSITALRYRAFGPATRDECEQFVNRNDGGSTSHEFASGEIPWPLKEARASR